jgi:tRNA modification GTPase
VELLAGVFSRPQKLLSAAGNTIVHGWIQGPPLKGLDPAGEPPNPVDEVLISVYRGPKSYTGEDGADISCHGGSAAVRAVLETLGRAGFSEALPGEFTFRSFMNGKLDLTQSESVMELVSAKTGKALEGAVRRLSGVLAEELGVIRDLLVEVLSAAELYLDYSEDEISLPHTEEAMGILPKRKEAEEALRRLEALRASYHRERLYQEGALVVIAGRPNAGKSSLFNALLREDRSIVTATPGTTRDWIEAGLSLEGMPLRLADTAGLRDGEDSSGSLNEAELLGIERSRELIDEADCILYVIDGEKGLLPSDLAFLEKIRGEGKKCLALWNKIDTAGPPPAEIPLLGLSAKTGEAVNLLCPELPKILQAEFSRETGRELRADLGTPRQKKLADTAFEALEEALKMAGRGEALDLIAPRLKDAVNALGEITGEISTADILEAMFSRFCVGK